MFKKFGHRWNDKDHRKSFIYQEMRAKFRAKKANAKRAGWKFEIDFGDLEFLSKIKFPKFKLEISPKIVI